MAERGKKARAPGVAEELARSFGAATAQFNGAVAERLGVGSTDQKCLEIVQQQGGSATPGLLAEHTGLTSGAITAVLDRLEKAGFVRRDKDPGDRRQVVVRLAPERAPEISALFEPLRRGWRELCGRRGDKELAVIAEFLQQATALLHKEAGELRGAPAAEAPAGDASTLSAPRAGAARGKLEVLRGTSRLAISAGPEELLYRVKSEGGAPKVTVRDGRVGVELVRSLARLFTRRTTHLELCPDIPWDLVLRGGVANLQADLRGLRIAGVEVAGGVNDALLKLPTPHGTVAVRVDGGVHKLRVERPLRAPARVLIESNANGLVIDTLKLGSVGGETRWESPDYAASRDRYDFVIRGGSHDLAIVAV
jgi:DNA-binding MarR family transcriptional regulator